MTSDDIANTIKALKAESAKIHADDKQTVETINELIDRLETEISTEHSQSMAEQVSTMIETTEARHPKLTLVLNDLMVKLASIGV